MQYFRNYRLAETYQVHPTTVAHWIDAARQGKNDLTLISDGGKSYIANTSKNVQIIKALVEKHSKFRNGRSLRAVSPKPQFSALYTPAQRYDICSAIEIYREIPLQYGYFDGGASYWDKYAHRLLGEETPNNLKSTLKLLDLNAAYLDELISSYNHVNVVDVGVGNGLPVRDLLRRLLDNGKLGRFVAIDMSADILDIAQSNIKEWFGGKVRFEDYQLDFSQERFANILADSYVGRRSGSTLNLVLFVGGTIQNFREPDLVFKTIRDSLGADDVLVHQQKLDTEESRRYFDFNLEATPTLAPNHRFIFDLLNINDSLYEVEMGYDEASHQRYIRARMKVSVEIEFEFEDGERVISLKKGDTILVWRAWQQSGLEATQLLDKCGFYVLQASETSDHEYLLTISQRKRVTG